MRLAKFPFLVELLVIAAIYVVLFPENEQGNPIRGTIGGKESQRD